MAEQMNSYELSRAFTDWAFENPQKIKPIHYAIYFFAIEHCNRLGWKKNFGLPSQMVMEAIGVKNWRTYSNGLKDLVDFGFIKMIETSRNQYSSNIIAIVKNTKAQSKALDRALSKHSQKQGIKHSQGTVSINKQGTRNKEQLNKEQCVKIPFDKFWNLYDKKVGKKDKVQKKWDSLSLETQNKIIDHIPKYKISQPDKQYRKNPETFLNNESWNDEIITPTNNAKPFTPKSRDEINRESRDARKQEILAKLHAQNRGSDQTGGSQPDGEIEQGFDDWTAAD